MALSVSKIIRNSIEYNKLVLNGEVAYEVVTVPDGWHESGGNIN